MTKSTNWKQIAMTQKQEIAKLKREMKNNRQLEDAIYNALLRAYNVTSAATARAVSENMSKDRW